MSVITPNSVADFEARMRAFIAAKISTIIPLAQNFAGQALKDGEIAFEELAEAAGAAVLKHAEAVMSGEQKANAAISDVLSEVRACGATVSRKTAETAVEQAYVLISAAAASAKTDPAA